MGIERYMYLEDVSESPLDHVVIRGRTLIEVEKAQIGSMKIKSHICG